MNLGTASGNDKGAITGKVKLRYDAGGSSWQGGSYNNMFKAVVVDANLTQVAPPDRSLFRMRWWASPLPQRKRT